MTWDYHRKDYKKQAKADPVWRLERLIKYGLGKEKIKIDDLRKYLPKLRVPLHVKKFLHLLVHETKSPHARTKKRH